MQKWVFFFASLVCILSVVHLLTWSDRTLQQQGNDNDNNDKENPLQVVCISLPHRQVSHFYPLRTALQTAGFDVKLVTGINGKELNLYDYDLTPHYRAFFENNARERKEGKTNRDYRGHLGCTLTHREVFRQVESMTLLLEDDVDIHDHLKSRIHAALAAVTELDPHWELLMLGFSANYTDHAPHKLNDRSPIYPGGIVRLSAWIGGWATVIRNRTVAQKIVGHSEPLRWHWDLSLSELARSGVIRAYGCIPTIIDHPGSIRISSFDYTQEGAWQNGRLRTDTNA